ncbi:MAG: hypothetical protein HY268_31450 [Deltaproteobacteria bacterium]|nr:hypothetical protein [Deltaproteobacteria bacterium]
MAGTILQDRNEPFVIDFGSGHRVAGTVQVRVMREEIDGTLDFYYHFTVTENTALGQCCNRLVVGTGFTGVLTEVEVRTDSLGNTSPLQASRSADGSEISFDFSPGLLPADESLFFFVRTDAISFKEGDKGSLAQGELSVTQFPVLQPEGEAASVQP